MAIQGSSALSLLASALAGNSSRFVVNKASIGSALAGQLLSMWRATGFPGQAAIPGTTPAVPTKATLGAIDFVNQTSPATSYFAWAELICGNGGGGVEVHDRIAHVGGLVANVTTSQTITGLDLLTIGVPAERLGAADYSDVQWFLEVYANTGATAATATINVTYGDGSTGNLTAQSINGWNAGRFFSLIPLIPSADQGKKIRAINSVILSASTGTAGNFGFTCTRQRTGKSFNLAGQPTTINWTDGLPEVPNDSCLMFAINAATTSSGTLVGQGKIAHG